MSTLEQYRDIRLELADTLRAQLYLARERKDTVLEPAIRELLARLAGDTFTVAVAGQFSRGKTTMLNALLGADYLPTGALPLTSVLTRISYASTEAAVYRRRGSDTNLPVAISDVPDLIARQSARRSELQVTGVDIRLPAELLRLGVTFVDTPGVGGIDAATSAITLGFLPEADALILVTSADSALNDTDLSLLDQLPPTMHMFCVVNKIDLVTAAEAEDVATAVRAVLAECRPVATSEVFTLSALAGLRAARSLRPEDDDGGVGLFRARLVRFLTSSRMPVSLTSIRDRAASLARAQRTLLDLAAQHASAPGPRRDAADAVVADARSQTSPRQAALISRIRARLDAYVSALWEEPGWVLPEDVVTATDAGLDAMMSARAGRLTEVAVRAAVPDLAELAATSTAPMDAAIHNVLGMPSDHVAAPWDPASLPPVASTRLHREPVEQEEAFRWPGHDRRAAALRHQQARRLAAEDQDQSALRLDQWVQAVERHARQRVEQEAVRLDAYLNGPATPAQFDALTRVERHLADISTSLDSLPITSDESIEHDSLGSVAQSGHANRTEKRCVVCARQRDALVRDLARRQFLLATREADQEALAGARGLCPVHTWSYAATSSPLGISAAYAPLAEAAAQSLRTMSADVLARGASALARGPASCPVCARVASAEDEAIGELRTEDTVCIRHLAVAAAATGSEPDLLRSLAGHLIETLTRDAQDMRGYAMKREAQTRALLTAEESRAHREALLLLAGDPALTLPLVNEQERDELGFS